MQQPKSMFHVCARLCVSLCVCVYKEIKVNVEENVEQKCQTIKRQLGKGWEQSGKKKNG